MKIFDLHNDFLTDIKEISLKSKYIDNNSFHTITMALWSSMLCKNMLDDHLHEAQFLLRNHTNLRFAVEDFGFADTRYFYIIKVLKPLYVGLCWNHDNLLAGGALDSGNLTKKGEDYIKKLNDANVAIDTAHLNRKSFSRVLEKSNKVLCSHTAFYTKLHHERNLMDYQIKHIIDKGGIVGLCTVPEFLTGSNTADIKDYASHIEYFLDKFGDKNLAIGTDFHGTNHLPTDLKTYTDFEKLKILLTKKGYSNQTIANIFYKNAERFYLNLTLSAD